MKKNLTKRISLVLLALVMLTSCFVGGTFAKYVTSVNLGGNDDYSSNGDGSAARVAKWGVEITGYTAGENGANGKLALFSNQYATHDTVTYSKTYSVISSNGDYVVAPGTGNVDEDGKPLSGAMVIELSGKPEVAAQVKVSATVTLNGSWQDASGNFYCPLIFYVGGKTVNGADCTSVDALNTALTNAVYTYICDPNTDLGELTDGTGNTDISVTIGWEWPFYVSNTNDVKDTALGNAAALAAETESTTDDLAVTVTASVSVTQID